MRTKLLLFVVALSSLVPSGAYSREWQVDDTCFGIIRGWTTTYYNSNANYLAWENGGKKLDAAIRALKGSPTGTSNYKCALQYGVPGKTVSGTRTPDGQCVALVRSVSMLGPHTGWRRGVNVMSPPSGKTIAPGTIVARFVYSASLGRYVYVDDHTGIFAGYRSDFAGGGFLIYDCNWYGEFITAHGLKRGGTGFSNPYEYYVVETN